MRDIDDGNIFRLEPADERKKFFNVLGRERTRRLVQHQHAAVERHGAGDLHQLLLRDGEAAHLRFGRDVREADFRQRGGGATFHLRPVHQRPARRLDAEQNIFHHGQMRREREFLINHRHAGLARVERIAGNVSRAVEKHLALVRRNRAGQNFHQRGFARAVFADERHDFAGRDGQLHAAQRLRRAEAPAHAAHFESGGIGHGELLERLTPVNFVILWLYVS